jgi:hypothetical protein
MWKARRPPVASSVGVTFSSAAEALIHFLKTYGAAEKPRPFKPRASRSLP